MGKSNTVQVTLKTIADISDVTSNVKQIQRALSGLSLPNGLENQFTKIMANVEKNATKASNVLAAGFKTKGDVTAYERATNLIVEDMKKIVQLTGQIDTSKLDFNIDESKSKTLLNNIEHLRQEIDSIKTQNLEKLQALVNNKPSSAKAWDDFFNAFSRGDDGIADAEKALARLQTQVEKAQIAGKDFSTGSQWSKYAQGVDVCANALKTLKGETGEVAGKQEELNQLIRALADLQQQANNSGTNWFNDFVSQVQTSSTETQNLARSTQQAYGASQRLGSELETFKSRAAYFFGLNNAVNLFQRSLRSAYDTVRELDSVMSEMAVVTDFSIGDIWEQLPEYTARANQLGVSIADTYESMTIFYQQGLDTDEALALSNETLKMARIAGLDAAEATDRMTNALRGFNMELNETNAQLVDDVYNKLAAISASNVDEISTAMTKVASLAHNANMEFETTSAFLAQMIETTRESAETAGTALKTVVARFSEVKELYSEGELLGTDSEGEAIDVNKVSTALRTAGINLNEYLTGMKGLDDIFIELAEKWDNLDIIQQRYIATMAAGSRQQSRFIAMMSDYGRTMELVNAANNSGGSANEMFEKTMESLETKVNKLSNAWDEFVMAIANNKLIKGAVDSLTTLLNIVNKLTGNSGIAKIGVAFASLKLGGAIVTKMFEGIFPYFRKSGEDGGNAFSNGFTEILNKRFATKDVMSSMVGIEEFNQQVLGLTRTGTIMDKSVQDLYRTMGKLDKVDDSLIKTLNTLKANGKITETQINLLGKSGALRLAETVAIGNEAKTTAILNEAKGREVALQEGGIKGLLTTIGLTATGTLAKEEETAVTWQNVKAKLAEELAQKGVNKAMLLGLGIIGLIVAAIAGLIAIVSVLIRYFKNSTVEAKLESAKDAADKAADSAEAAANAFTELNNAWEALQDKYSSLDNMTRGTDEWRKAVQEVNSEVMDLIANYDNVQTHLEDGVLVIDNMEQVLSEYSSRSNQAAAASIGAKRAVDQAQLNVSYEGLSSASKASNLSADLTGAYNLIDNEEVTRDIARKVAEGQLTNIEQIQKEAEAHGLLMAQVTEGSQEAKDIINELRKFGAELLNTETQLSSYNDALLAGAIQEANIDEEAQRYVSNFFNDDLVNSIRDSIEAEIDAGGNGNKIDQLREEFAKGQNYSSYKAYKKENGKASMDLIKAQVAEARAQTEATERVKQFSDALGGMPDLVKKLFEQGEGQALTQKDLHELTGTTYDQIINKDPRDLDTYAVKFWNEMDDSARAVYGDLTQFQARFTEAVTLSATAYDDATKQLSMFDFKLNAEQLSSGAMKELAEQFTSVLETTGRESADKIRDEFNQIMEQLSDEDAEKFANALSSIDWKSTDSIKTFDKLLVDLGVDTTGLNKDIEDFESTIIECADAVANVDLDTLTGQIQSMASLANQVINGSQGRSFAEGDYNTLVESGAMNASDFVYDINTGNYDYIGDSTQDIVNAIQEQTRQLLGTDQLEKRIASGTAFNNTANEFGNVDINSVDALADFLRQYDKNAGKNSMIDMNAVATYEQNNALEQLQQMYNQLLDTAANLSNNVDQQQNFQHQSLVANQQLASTSYNASALVDDNEEKDIYREALTAQATAAGVANEVLDEYIPKLKEANEEKRLMAAYQLASITDTYNEATAYGIDKEQLQSYANTLQMTNQSLNEAQALRIALANTKLNTGLNEIISSYKDWTALIDSSTGLIKASTSDDAAAFNALQKSVNKMLNTSHDLSDAFWNNAENMENLKHAAEGDLEALGALQTAAAQDYLLTIRSEFDTAESVQAIDDFIDLLNNTQLPTLEAGAQLDDQAFIDACKNLITASGMTSEQVANAFKEMGYDVEFADNMQEVSETERFPIITYRQHGSIMKGNMIMEPIFDVKEVSFKRQVPAPTIKTLTSTGSQGGGVSHSNVSSAAANRPTSSGGSSGGSRKTPSSSSSSSTPTSTSDTSEQEVEKPTFWENAFEEIYNLQEKINESLRTREALERRYQKLLKNTASSVAEVRKAYYNQINQLRAEADLQEQIAAGRLEQIQNLKYKRIVDEEGNITDYEDMGVSRYASYNTSTGLITIDWDALDAISLDTSRVEEGEMAEAYINQLQQMVSSYEDVRDKLWDIEDKIEELRETAIQSYLSFEDRVLEAVEHQYQDQIDSFSTMNDTINNTTSEVLNSIKEQIDLERQIRDNTKTEDNIMEMESRLGYLRRDTSGANDLEIRKLEEDLDNARQNYSDHLVDQAINQMQKDADLAAEQRARQQEVMQEQLSVMKETGALWKQVHQLINTAMGPDQTFSRNSELAKLLRANESYSALSAIGKQAWWEEAAKAFKEAKVGLEEAEDKYVVDGNDDLLVKKSGTQSSISSPTTATSSYASHYSSTSSSSTSSSSSSKNYDAKQKYGVALAIINGGYGWGTGDTRKRNLQSKGFNYNEIQNIVNKLMAEGKVRSGAWVGAYYGIRDLAPYAMKKFAQGGLADFTGPAWLDGSKSHPELVLNAADSQNFITLKNILSQLLSGQNGSNFNSTSGDNYFDIDISAELGSDYDVDQLAERIKKQIYDNGIYRNVNTMSYLR